MLIWILVDWLALLRQLETVHPSQNSEEPIASSWKKTSSELLTSTYQAIGQLLLKLQVLKINLEVFEVVKNLRQRDRVHRGLAILLGQVDHARSGIGLWELVIKMLTDDLSAVPMP